MFFEFLRSVFDVSSILMPLKGRAKIIRRYAATRLFPQ
jgi:hypothetical protein